MTHKRASKAVESLKPYSKGKRKRANEDDSQEEEEEEEEEDGSDETPSSSSCSSSEEDSAEEDSDLDDEVCTVDVNTDDEQNGQKEDHVDISRNVEAVEPSSTKDGVRDEDRGAADAATVRFLVDMSGPCCAHLEEWQRKHASTVTPERMACIKRDVSMLQGAKTVAAHVAASISLVTNMADAHTDRYKGETWLVNAVETNQVYALAKHALDFSESTQGRIKSAIAILEEVFSLGNGMLAEVAKAAKSGSEKDASVGAREP